MISKYFSIVGYSKSGKTFLIERIAKYLVNQGYSVAVCKYIHHAGSCFGIDIPDKDTTKFYESGVKIVSYVSPDASGIIYIQKENPDLIFRNIENKVDYLILEGFRELTGVPRIAMIKEKSDLSNLIDDYTMGVTSHLIDLSKHKLFIKFEDIPSFVEKRALPPETKLNCLKCGYNSCKEFYKALLQEKEDISKCVLQIRKVKLFVNEKLISINPFVEKILENVITGIVETLEKPDEEINLIEININK